MMQNEHIWLTFEYVFNATYCYQVSLFQKSYDWKIGNKFAVKFELCASYFGWSFLKSVKFFLVIFFAFLSCRITVLGIDIKAALLKNWLSTTSKRPQMLPNNNFKVNSSDNESHQISACCKKDAFDFTLALQKH